jgi:hypothetical protein
VGRSDEGGLALASDGFSVHDLALGGSRVSVLQDVVDQLVDDRSFDALDRLTGSKSDEVLEALIEAAGRLINSPRFDDDEDRIVETIRSHLVESKGVGVLVDALKGNDEATIEFALACLSEIGDTLAVPNMIRLLEGKSDATRDAAAEHLALLTHYDFGKDPTKWREWYAKLVAGRHEQVEEDREDKERLLRLKFRTGKKKDEEPEEPDYNDFGGGPRDFGGYGGYGR